MSTEHTPGPWRVTPSDAESCQLGVGQYVQDSAGNHVAYAARSQADAYLIAAAPELYEALTDLLEQLKKGGFINEHGDAMGLFAMEKVHAAIAKAEGS